MPSLNRPVTRRRALLIAAAVFGTPLLGEHAHAKSVTWAGQALGAHATIELMGISEERASVLFARVEAEIRRLEGLFSLYRADSALSRLNSEGSLEAPEPEMLELLTFADQIHRETGGLFDPTVQPLFDLYARHFATPDADPAGPSREALSATLARIGFAGVSYDEAAIRFARPGMALTFNGIAQGYITDRIADLLRAEGFGNMLLDIGEIRAIGPGRAGRGWRVGIEGRTGGIDLIDRAVATSRPLGTVLDAGGTIGHIFDPRRGFVPGGIVQATVIAPRAAEADALSTAAVLMTPDAAGRMATGERRILI
jgi:thiamine biosynthesis lipoprotein